MKRLLLVALAVIFVTGDARAADERDDSEMWLKLGVQLRRAGEHEDALAAFIRAHKARPSAKTLAQIGLAHQSLHDWARSADCLASALATHEDWVEKNRRPLEDALATVETHIGWVLVTGPSGATVSLDELSVGSLPMKEIRADEGEHFARVAKDGFETWSSKVRVVAGKTVEVVAILEQAKPRALAAGVVPPYLDVGRPVAGSSRVPGIIAGGLLGAGVSVATIGAVIWIQQKSGAFEGYQTGATGPALLAGGLLGALAGGVGLYLTRDRPVAVGMTAYGPMVAGRF